MIISLQNLFMGGITSYKNQGVLNNNLKELINRPSSIEDFPHRKSEFSVRMVDDQMEVSVI